MLNANDLTDAQQSLLFEILHSAIEEYENFANEISAHDIKMPTFTNEKHWQARHQLVDLQRAIFKDANFFWCSKEQKFLKEKSNLENRVAKNFENLNEGKL